MGLLSILATVVIQAYYKGKNKQVDPRIAEARKLYEQYNALTEENNIDSIIQLLDVIESAYQSVPHYTRSYERGVIYNNRAAIWLTEGLYGAESLPARQDSFIHLADNALRKGIDIYTDWKASYQQLDEEEIEQRIKTGFIQGLEQYPPEEKNEFLENRVDEIIEGQAEIDRRLSVSYTNLGIIYRYHEAYDSAVHYYQEALKLWERNLTAENNMNKLLGRPMRKRGFIEKMFPRERL